jgi:subtilisin family serine protease
VLKRQRWSIVAVFALVLPVLATAAAPPAAALDRSKLTAEMSWFVDRGGYGSYPIAKLDPNFKPGNVYYLARVSGQIDAQLVSALTGAGARVRFRFPEISSVALVSPMSAIGPVSQLTRVSRLVLDEPREVLGATVQFLTGSPYADQSKRGTHDVGADQLWAAGTTGEGVRVGVVDTGIDATHSDLNVAGFVNCMAVVPTIVGDDAGACVSQPGVDDNGHGTHVSGIATGDATGGTPAQGGLYPGMAPGAELVGAKVCNAGGSCLNSSIMAGVRALAVEPAQGGLGADVINLSLGGSRFFLEPLEGSALETNDDPGAQQLDALARLNNVLFTVAAGNSGPVLGSVSNPSIASQVLSVGASVADWDLNHPVDQTVHGEFGDIRTAAVAAGATGIAQFSSRGPSGDRLIKPEVTAPGVYVVSAQAVSGAEVGAGDAAHNNFFSTDPNYAVLSGTSMAAPSAAGVATLVWSGYKTAIGADPAYFRLKAALSNTAGTHAFEGSVAGLLSGIRAKHLGEDLAVTFPLRNQSWVGVTGEGAGRLNAPAALAALTRGVQIYTLQVGALDNVRELQPNWSLDDVGRGESRTQAFVLHGGPLLASSAGATTFSLQPGTEARGVSSAPASWFTVPSSTSTTRNGDKAFSIKLKVPSGAAPGMYTSTVIATSKVAKNVTQKVRIPVQFFVPLTATSLEGSVWAYDVTDYTATGFANPLGDIYTDFAEFPIRLPAGSTNVQLAVCDVAGLDHMDVFVYDQTGNEIDSTVASDLADGLPGGAGYTPTTCDDPHVVSILDDADYVTPSLPTTVWVNVADSGPHAVGFSTFRLTVQA